jgi:hypothetical protein
MIKQIIDYECKEKNLHKYRKARLAINLTNANKGNWFTIRYDKHIKNTEGKLLPVFKLLDYTIKLENGNTKKVPIELFSTGFDLFTN